MPKVTFNTLINSLSGRLGDLIFYQTTRGTRLRASGGVLLAPAA
jgi:hypothetical protein